jgi:hypothetical protein
MLKIILIFVLAVGFYFIVSPYQNCLRDIDSDSRNAVGRCVSETSW